MPRNLIIAAMHGQLIENEMQVYISLSHLIEQFPSKCDVLLWAQLITEQFVVGH